MKMPVAERAGAMMRESLTAVRTGVGLLPWGVRTSDPQEGRELCARRLCPPPLAHQ